MLGASEPQRGARPRPYDWLSSGRRDVGSSYDHRGSGHDGAAARIRTEGHLLHRARGEVLRSAVAVRIVRQIVTRKHVRRELETPRPASGDGRSVQPDADDYTSKLVKL